MHAFYRRLLHLHNAHHDVARPETPASEPTPLHELASQMRAATPAPPSPRLRQRSGRDRDRKPSVHALVVPGLIESGCTLDQISDLTGMPRAFVELIADEQRRAAVTNPAAESIRDFLQAKLREAELARRRRTRAAAAIVVVAVFNIAAGLASLIWHVPALGAAATLGSVLLILAVFVLPRRDMRRPTRRSDPPQ